MLGARTTVTPFHHQPEAQHLKSLAIHKNAGRLPHLGAKNRTHAAQQRSSLFDHLVGEQLHRIGDGKTERLGGLEVDHQLELRRQLDRQIGRLRAFEDAIDIPCRLTELLRSIYPAA
jgi:hypothetical protein